MPGSSKHDEQVRKAQKQFWQKRTADVWARISRSERDRADGRNDAGDSDGDNAAPGAAGVHPGGESVDRGVVGLPSEASAWKTLSTGMIVSDDMSELLLREQEYYRGKLQEIGTRQLWGNPQYAKPGRIAGFFARRLGKKFRPKEKPVSQPRTMSPNEVAQAQKFNVATAAGKGVSPLLTKKAVGVVAIVTMLASGWLGKEVMVDEQTIGTAIDNGYQVYLSVMAFIAAATWFYKFARNIYTEWGRIRAHGVKISGPNAAFDFAPRNGSGE